MPRASTSNVLSAWTKSSAGAPPAARTACTAILCHSSATAKLRENGEAAFLFGGMAQRKSAHGQVTRRVRLWESRL